jgi:peptide/nickel transport system permease protein
MTDAAVVIPQEIDTPERSLWGDVWLQFRHHRGAVAGMVIFGLIVFAVVFGPYIYRVDPQFLDLRARNAPPSWDRPMGTDNLGRDILAQVLQGGRVSLAVGVTAMLLSLFLGTLIGVLAGYFRRIDGFLMRTTDLFLALPILPLLLVIILLFRDSLRAAFGPETGIFLLIVIVIGITSWMQTARIVRGDVLALKEREFVLAAKSIGTPPRRIITRHVLPNVLSPDHGLGHAGGGERDHHRKRPQLPRPGLSVRLPDLGAALVRRGELHDADAEPGDLAGARDLADGAERQLHRRRAARRARSPHSRSVIFALATKCEHMRQSC